MKVVKIAAVAATSLVVANTAANLTIKKTQASTGFKHVVRDAVRAVVTPAPLTYRKLVNTAA